MKKGFTIAEVLITLGIIGIIAAITLPTVINNAKERETVAKVKKFYSVMSQALLMSIGKHGYVDEWGFCEEYNAECATQFVSNFRSELKVIRDCANNSNCIAQNGYKYLNGNSFSSNYGNGDLYYKMILNDGSYLWIRHNNSNTCKNNDASTANVCGLIWYDLNGAKLPNQLGKDIFVFAFRPLLKGYYNQFYKKGIQPYLAVKSTIDDDGNVKWEGSLTEADLYTDPVYGCYKNNKYGGAVYCTQIIFLNGWKIPDDYPFRF